MSIKAAGQRFLNDPKFRRALLVGGGAGAGATALAHLINAPKDEQVVIVQEADDRGLSATELIIGALAAGMFGEGAYIFGEDHQAVEDVAANIRRDELIRQETEPAAKKARK